jgi:protease-4
MKSFFASFVGTLLGLFAFVIVSVVLLFGGFALLASMGQRTVPVAVDANSYLVLDLAGTNLTDAPPLVDAGGLAELVSGDSPRVLSLRAATAGLRRAAKDTRIRGVFITGSFSPDAYGTGFAALAELRLALTAFRGEGKPVRAYFDEVGTAELYLASVADEITLNPFGLVVLPGLATEPIFFADALEKWGVGVQVTRSGKYKGAVEPFLRRDLSPENREQLSVLLDDLWTVLREDISEARGLRPEALQTLVDAEGLISPESARHAGLVHGLAYRDEVLARLRTETGASSDEPFKQVAFADYLRSPEGPARGRGDSIAVIYAEGEIVDGEGFEGEVGGAAFSRELRALREDEAIRAVVLRVNSPGGSASASEDILREVRLLRDKKPVVVSLGSYAASGGYWISAYGDRVFTGLTTVTGSIGVFGVQFDIEELGGKVGVTWDQVSTGKKAGMLTASRPKTEAELAVFQRLVDHTYEAFLDRVAEGRSLERGAVERIAQGRVWSGAQARALGLADEIGGLDAAIQHAAMLAGIEGEPELYEYPSTRPLAEALADFFDERSYPQSGLGRRVGGPLGEVFSRVEAQARSLARYNDPRGVYVRLPLDLRVR